MKYKIGDKVRIKSFDWYNQNKDEDGLVHCGDKVFDDYMSVFCGSIVTIGEIFHIGYDVEEDMQCRTWTEDMFEGLADAEPQDKMVSLNKVEKYLRENIILYVWATNLDKREEWFSDFRKTMEG